MDKKEDSKTKRRAEGKIYLILAVVWAVLAAVCHRHLIEMIAFAAVAVFMAVKAALKFRSSSGMEE